MSKWIEYQPCIDEIRHEWCNKCNKTCPYNNCKIYRVMQILRRQKPIPHGNEGLWTIITVTKNNHIYGTCSNCGYQVYVNSYCGNCGSRNRLPKDFEQRYL